MNEGVDEIEEVAFSLSPTVSEAFDSISSSPEASQNPPTSPPTLSFLKIDHEMKRERFHHLKSNPHLTKGDVLYIDWRQQQGQEIISAGHQKRPVKRFIAKNDFNQMCGKYQTPIKKRSIDQTMFFETDTPQNTPDTKFEDFDDDDISKKLFSKRKVTFA